MFVSSITKLVPCATESQVHGILFRIASTDDNLFVEEKGDKYYKKGELISDTYVNTQSPIFLTDDKSVRQAAKELLNSRPTPSGEDVAAVMIRDQNSAYISWYRVSNKGAIKLFANADPIDITGMEDGDVFTSGNREIYFSPITAINAVKKFLESAIDDIHREASEREEKEASEIRRAKSFIDKLKKAQKI